MNETDFVNLDLQIALDAESIPHSEQITQWISAALKQQAQSQKNTLEKSYELTVRVVDVEEIQSLNNTYRHKDKPTNVLSFPFEAPAEIDLPLPLLLLGDIIICHPVIIEEAQQQQKTLNDHWAHMVVHGVLHLLGYDHIEEDQAQEMEALEISILEQFNIANPYE